MDYNQFKLNHPRFEMTEDEFQFLVDAKPMIHYGANAHAELVRIAARFMTTAVSMQEPIPDLKARIYSWFNVSSYLYSTIT